MKPGVPGSVPVSSWKQGEGSPVPADGRGRKEAVHGVVGWANNCSALMLLVSLWGNSWICRGLCFLTECRAVAGRLCSPVALWASGFSRMRDGEFKGSSLKYLISQSTPAVVKWWQEEGELPLLCPALRESTSALTSSYSALCARCLTLKKHFCKHTSAL